MDTETMLKLALPMLRNTGLLAFVALAYGIVLSRWRTAPTAAVLGLLCGAGAILAMLDPTEIEPGVIVDSRTTLLMLSGFFAGPFAAAISGVMAAAFRIHVGGLGVPAGVAIIAISASLGVAGHYLLVAGRPEVRPRDLAVFACSAPLASLGIFVLPFDTAVEVFRETFVPVNTVRIVGVAFLGMLLLHERRRISAEDQVTRLAFTDELSSLSNRRAFYVDLNRAWDRWQRSREPFCLVVIDIDRFKSINDQHGHPTGDEVIRTLAAAMREECRASDVAARLGGEEFALLLPGADSGHGAAVAERIRSRVAEQLIRSESGQTLRFTASFGVSAPLATLRSRADVLSSADDALYIAKRTGRNSVRIDTRDRRRQDAYAGTENAPLRQQA